KHPNKTIANIILPYSTKDDESSINNFLKTMARNDTRIKKSYESKVLGGYISLDTINQNNETNEDVEFRYEKIYNNLGTLKNTADIWGSKKDLLFEYCDNNKKTPYTEIIFKNTHIGIFLDNQKRKIFDKNCELYKLLSA